MTSSTARLVVCSLLGVIGALGCADDSSRLRRPGGPSVSDGGAEEEEEDGPLGKATSSPLPAPRGGAMRCGVDAAGNVVEGDRAAAGSVLEGEVRSTSDGASCVMCRDGAWAMDRASPNTARQCTNKAAPLRDFPVLSIAFTPDADGDGRVDRATTDVDEPVAVLERRIRTMEVDIVGLMKEGTRYKGFRDPSARPSLGYRVVAERTLRTAVPRGLSIGPGEWRPDYMTILRDADICRWVEKENVREVWIWTQHHAGIVPAESNLSSSFGDVSNSERTDDLPRCARAYAVYNYNFTRGPAEALHNHGHHLEAVLREWDPTRLFWTKFVGSTEGQSALVGTTRRCGWTHYPPNAKSDYDYRSTSAVASDCEAWSPAALGASKPTSCATFAQYRYGSGDCRDDGGLAFYVWWMQNLPGEGNGLVANGRSLRNWWDYLADLDRVVAEGSGPYSK